jgi:hypothetical protein
MGSMSEKVYEMLWDCRYCGAVKLLGKTHRHCPSCGAPQENAPRYFPADSEKVAVEDHVFVGADVICPACGTSASRAAKHCGGCGSPLEGAKEVARRQDRVHDEAEVFTGETVKDASRELAQAKAPPAPAPEPKKSARTLALGGCGCLTLAGVVTLLLVFVFWRKEAGFEVTGHAWLRSIEVERFEAVEESKWCDEMPSGAIEIRRDKAERDKKKVQDGEDCKVRKVDQGDGTYKEKKECKPRYREEPVLADKCTYRVHRWKTARTEKATGDLSTPPRWPAVSLAKTGECTGCEREGKRSETYTVKLTDTRSGKTEECEVEQAKWQSMKPKTRWKGEVRVMGGGLACATLAPQ